MASLLSTPSLRRRLLQLPPSLRVSAYLNHQPIASSASHLHRPPPPLSSSSSTSSRRAFSATARRPAPEVAENVTYSAGQILATPFTTLLDSIHAIGLPWWAAIPFAAILIRGTLGYYLASLPRRKREIIRSNMTSLVAAIVQMRFDTFMMRWQNRTGGKIPSKLLRTLTAFRFQTAETHRIGKTFGAPVFTPGIFVNMGLLVGFAEAVRIKCGSRVGLLSLAARPFEWLFSKGSASEAAAQQPPLSKEQELANRIWEKMQSTNAGSGANAPVQLEPMKGTTTYADFLDPSLQVEGLSWCPDLTVADPVYGLPIIYAVGMIARAFITTRHKPLSFKSEQMNEHVAKVDSGQAQPTLSQTHSGLSARAAKEVNAALEFADKLSKESAYKARREQSIIARIPLRTRQQILFSVVFAFIVSGLPAGVLLYMVPFFATGVVQELWLQYKYPLLEPIKPCARPLRQKFRREIGDSKRLRR